MPTTIAIIGGQWGDEGKGKIVDVLAQDAGMVVRFAGGNNAGHTIVVGPRKYKFHIVPSGIIHDGCVSVIAGGTVIDPTVLLAEIDRLEKIGVKVTPDKLVVSSTAHVITPEHVQADDPQAGTAKKVGTTGRGIGPAYRAKVARTGLRMGSFIKQGGDEAKRLAPFVKPTAYLLNAALDKSSKIVFEGAQATLLDIDHGTYPFVTSSNCTIGGAISGTGVPASRIGQVIGIFKAYATRVGRGPFMTELGSEEAMASEVPVWEAKVGELEKVCETANTGDAAAQGRYMRMQGVEYGTTTSRPRRTGWFDALAARYSVMINGMERFCVMKLDVLSGLKIIKVAIAYELDGERLEQMPLDADDLARAEPVYEELEGWDEDITSVRSYDQLPAQARAYLSRLEELLGIPIAVVSVGPKRDQTIIRGDLW